MHKKKTGALISCAIKFGALLNNANEQDLLILDSFSNYIGLAYQVQDDVLDITTSEEVLGKRQNSDSKNNKPSYPAIIGLDESIRSYKNLYQRGLDELSHLSVESKPLKLITERLMNRVF